MRTDGERRIRRLPEEPLNQERRDFSLDAPSMVVAFSNMVLTPPYPQDFMHYHNCMELGICLVGSGVLCLENRKWTFSAGNVLLVPRGVRHAQHNEGAGLTHWRYVEVNEDKLLNEAPPNIRFVIQRLMNTIGDSVFFETDPECGKEISNLFQMMFDWHQRLGEDAIPEIEAALMLALTRLVRRPEEAILSVADISYQRQALEPALNYIAENYDQIIRIDQLARVCALSESHFRKMFHQALGMSPLEYLNRYRIHRSLNLLRLTKATIPNIALRTGFSSIATFNRNFIHYVGQTPTEWRKLHSHL